MAAPQSVALAANREVSANANRPGERHDLNAAGTSLAEGRRGCVSRGSGRIDVIDEHDRRRHRPERSERRRDVPAAFGPRQLALAGRATSAREKRLQTEVPEGGQLPAESLGRVMAAPQAPLRIWRDEDDALRIGANDRLGDDGGRPRRQTAQSAFLPGGDDAPHGAVVFDGRTRMREGKAPSGALRAAADRPDGGRAAAIAPGRAEPAEPGPAIRADRRAGQGAHETPLREEEVEHTPRLGRNVCRVCVSSVPNRARGAPQGSLQRRHRASRRAPGVRCR